jgi:hypothetical protein
MSEECTGYCTNTLLIDKHNCSVMKQEQTCVIDLVTFERLLIPMLNEVRKAQGKRPVIIPKG